MEGGVNVQETSEFNSLSESSAQDVFMFALIQAITELDIAVDRDIHRIKDLYDSGDQMSPVFKSEVVHAVNVSKQTCRLMEDLVQGIKIRFKAELDEKRMGILNTLAMFNLAQSKICDSFLSFSRRLETRTFSLFNFEGFYEEYANFTEHRARYYKAVTSIVTTLSSGANRDTVELPLDYRIAQLTAISSVVYYITREIKESQLKFQKSDFVTSDTGITVSVYRIGTICSNLKTVAKDCNNLPQEFLEILYEKCDTLSNEICKTFLDTVRHKGSEAYRRFFREYLSTAPEFRGIVEDAIDKFRNNGLRIVSAYE